MVNHLVGKFYLSFDNLNMNHKIVAQNNYNLIDFYRDIQNNPRKTPTLAVKAITANPNLLNTIISQAIMGAPSRYEETITSILREFPNKYKEILSTSVKFASVLDPFAHVSIFFITIDVLNNLSHPYTWQDLFDAIRNSNHSENDPIKELFKH